SQPLFLALLFLKIVNKNSLLLNLEERNNEDTKLLNAIKKLNLDVFSLGATRAPSYTMGEVNNRDHLKEDVCKYIELVESGFLYDFFGEESLLSRKDFKEKFFKEVLFGQNYIESDLTIEFTRLFPS